MNDTARELLRGLTQAERKGGEFLFTNPKTGTRYTSIKTAWLTACRNAGLSNLRFHDLRHYAEFRTMPSRTFQATRVACESRCSLLSAVSATRHSFRCPIGS